jgi:hypothetical protein
VGNANGSDVLDEDDGSDALGEDNVFVLPAGMLVYCLHTQNTNRTSTDMPRGPEMRRNPPVQIEDWSSDDEAGDVGGEGEDGSVASDIDNASVGSAERDPPFVERLDPLGLDPNDEPGMNEDELWNILHQHLGDLADDEWIDMCESVVIF